MTDLSRSWPLPEEVVAVRLMATIWADVEGIHDDLHEPAGFDAWMDAVAIAREGHAAATQFKEAVAIRDALRRLAALQTDDTRPAAASSIADPRRAADVLNAAAAHLPSPRLRLDTKTRRLNRTTTVDVPAALARIATDAIELFGGAGAEKLRACQAPGCVLYFVKTHPRREWCSVACGNRARAARHYQRIRRASANDAAVQ
jgi:predicted RNA-binding Zn ribbon-like protein